MTALREAAEEIRRSTERVARRSSPRAERFVVLRKKPILLESANSDLKLSEEDDDFEIGKGLRRHLKVGEFVHVITDRDGDRLVVSSSSGGGGGAAAGAEEEAAETAEAEAGIAALAKLGTAGLGVIVHGADENYPRGTDFGHYVWVGTVAPVNAIDVDFLAVTG